MKKFSIFYIPALFWGFIFLSTPPTGHAADFFRFSKKYEKADAIVVFKGDEMMVLMRNEEPVQSYSISLGFNPVGHKQHEGDGRTPEGLYQITEKLENSGYHKALLISYPNAEDKRSAQALGREPGGRIMIHGIKNGYGWVGILHRLYNWTQGCIAVTDNEIDEIWDLVDIGTPIFIYP